ncbi:class F sortase [Streptomyces sp. NBRC 110035]|uniref:class F sortase n=1 Tax=Streptomyces sp. NBRC 110035 TaxID=1547867 RepID=UPI0005AB463F|nr:class F sortase [Streptomyces sp. NBRC 110035]
MSTLSRRAFTTAALTSLLAGCGGHPAERNTDADTGTGTGTASTASPARPPAKSSPAHGRSVPLRLRIPAPAIGVDTPVMRLGLAPDGSMQVPPITAHDPAGWYEHSPTPGQTGPSVIVGHVTVGSHGDGVFRHLSALHRGDRIEARLENGRTAVFTVTSVRRVAKAEFPSDEVYGNVDRPELRLITCGGRRVGDTYLDNVIAFAAPGSAGPDT